MPSLITYQGIQVVTPEPTGTGGKAINDNFKALSTRVSDTAPGRDDNYADGFSQGSRWFDTSSGIEWLCIDQGSESSPDATWRNINQWSKTGAQISYDGDVSFSGSLSGGSVSSTAALVGGIVDLGNTAAPSPNLAANANLITVTFTGNASDIGNTLSPYFNGLRPGQLFTLVITNAAADSGSITVPWANTSTTITLYQSLAILYQTGPDGYNAGALAAAIAGN